MREAPPRGGALVGLERDAKDFGDALRGIVDPGRGDGVRLPVAFIDQEDLPLADAAAARREMKSINLDFRVGCMFCAESKQVKAQLEPSDVYHFQPPCFSLRGGSPSLRPPQRDEHRERDQPEGWPRPTLAIAPIL